MVVVEWEMVGSVGQGKSDLVGDVEGQVVGIEDIWGNLGQDETGECDGISKYQGEWRGVVWG